MNKFKVGEKVKVCHIKGNAQIREILGVDKNNKTCYLVETVAKDGYVWDVVWDDDLEKLPENKFKQGDILVRNDICGSNKYIVLMHDIDTQKAYKLCVIAGDDIYEILNWSKEVTERDFTKVGEV